MCLDTDSLCGSIPNVEIGPPGSRLVILSGGQAFLRRPDQERLRRDAVRLKRLMPKGRGFSLFGYGPRHYVEAGLDGLADSFAAILSCRSGPVQLVGISYGGLVAARIAARHPDLVSDLILVASAASFSEEGQARVQRQIKLARQRRYTELLAGFGGAFRRPWYNWLLRTRLRLRRARLVSEMNAPDEIVAYLEAAQSAHATDAHASLSRITARTLVMGGARDQFFGQRIANTANAIPDARLHLLPDETHMAPIERAAEFRREITALLGDSGRQMSNATRSDRAARPLAREGTQMSDRLNLEQRSLLIRPYDAASDLEPCMSVWRKASQAGHPFLGAATLDADASLVREHYMPAADVTVAETDGAVAGFLALLGSFIGGLFVDPSRHGQGIGRALVQEARCRHSALEVEVYEANAGARAFYARIGFVETGRRERDDQDRPLPLVAMRLGDQPLKPAAASGAADR